MNLNQPLLPNLLESIRNMEKHIINRSKSVSGEYTSKGSECERYIQNGAPFIKARLLEK
tara:strand:- start:111 stop:287 length:177 start_codon:yes stop_codon:yes gene_type:complete